MRTSAPPASTLTPDRDQAKPSRARLRTVYGAALRHPLLTTFLLALVIRLVVVIGLAVITDGVLARDDQTYWQMATQNAAGSTGEWNDYTHRLYLETSTFLLPLTWLAWLFGPVRLVGQVFVAVLGALTALFTTRLVLEWRPPPVALLAGTLVALIPSQVIFSSALLKDPAVWLCLSALGVAAAIASRSIGIRLLAAGLGVTLLLVLLAYLRIHVLIVAGWALVLAACWSVPTQRWPRVLAATGLALSVPALVGAGIGGTYFVASAGSLEERRLTNAERADSAFVAPVDGTDPVPSGGTGSPSGDGGPGATPAAPKDDPVLATEPLPPGGGEGAEISGTKGDLARLPAGLAAMLIQPYLWETGGSTQLRLARLEGIVWYPILLLALIGLPQVRRRLRVTAFPVLVGGGLLLVYALVEGNVGTAYRHRGDFVWVICILAALGTEYVYRRFRARSSGSGAAAPSPDV